VLEAVLALACGCGPKSIEACTGHAEKRADEAAEALDRAPKAADALEPHGKALRKHVHDAQASFATSPDFTEWAEHPLRKSDKALEVAAKPE
jgi:hypothetical protein